MTAAVTAAVLSALLAAPAAGRAEDESPAKKPFGSLEKSLLIPGWGQFAEKRYLEGVLFLGAELACLYGVFRTNRLGNERYALYKSSATTEDAVRHRRAVETYDRRRNAFLIAAAAVWAANLVDMALIVKSKDGGRRAVVLKAGCDILGEIRLSLACRY